VLDKIKIGSRVEYIKEGLLWWMAYETLKYGDVSYKELNEETEVRVFKEQTEKKQRDNFWSVQCRCRDGIVAGLNAALEKLHQLELTKDTKAKKTNVTAQIHKPNWGEKILINEADTYRKLIQEINTKFKFWQNTQNAIDTWIPLGANPASSPAASGPVNTATTTPLPLQVVAAGNTAAKPEADVHFVADKSKYTKYEYPDVSKLSKEEKDKLLEYYNLEREKLLKFVNEAGERKTELVRKYENPDTADWSLNTKKGKHQTIIAAIDDMNILVNRYHNLCDKIITLENSEMHKSIANRLKKFAADDVVDEAGNTTNKSGVNIAITVENKAGAGQPPPSPLQPLSGGIPAPGAATNASHPPAQTVASISPSQPLSGKNVASGAATNASPPPGGAGNAHASPTPAPGVVTIASSSPKVGSSVIAVPQSSDSDSNKMWIDKIKAVVTDTRALDAGNSFEKAIQKLANFQDEVKKGLMMVHGKDEDVIHRVKQLYYSNDDIKNVFKNLSEIEGVTVHNDNQAQTIRELTIAFRKLQSQHKTTESGNDALIQSIKTAIWGNNIPDNADIVAEIGQYKYYKTGFQVEKGQHETKMKQLKLDYEGEKKKLNIQMTNMEQEMHALTVELGKINNMYNQYLQNVINPCKKLLGYDKKDAQVNELSLEMKTRIERLKKQAEQAERMKDALGVVKEDKETADIVALYKKEKSDFQRACKTLKIERDNNEQHITVLEIQIKKIREDLSTTDVDASSNVAAVRTQLATTESELYTARSLYSTTQQSLTDATAEVTRCQAELSAANTKLSDQERVIEDGKQKIAILQDGLATAQSHGDRIDSELKNLRDQIERSHLSTSSGSEPVELRKDLVVLLGKLRGLMEFDFKTNATYDVQNLLSRIVEVIFSMFKDRDRELQIASLIQILEELLDALKNERKPDFRVLLQHLRAHAEDAQAYPGARHEGDHTERTRVEKSKEEDFLAMYDQSITRTPANTPAVVDNTPAAVTTADQPPVAVPEDTAQAKTADQPTADSRAAASKPAAETRGSGRDRAPVGSYAYHDDRFQPVNTPYNGRR